MITYSYCERFDCLFLFIVAHTRHPAVFASASATNPLQGQANALGLKRDEALISTLVSDEPHAVLAVIVISLLAALKILSLFNL